MSVKNRIADRFKSDDQGRQESLERARIAAALTKPWVLPPQGQPKNSKLPEQYQSIGSRGITNMGGRMLMALYPPGAPWYALEAPAAVIHNPDIDDAVKEEIRQRLFLRELMIQSVLESAQLRDRTRRRKAGFRSRKRMTIDQILITGDVLEQLTDDYRIKVFRRDQYTTKRDSSLDVLYHTVREEIDPLTLTDEQLATAELRKGELEDKEPGKRLMPIYTLVSWNPLSKVWVIEQEINGNVVVTSEEPVSPYFSTPFELAPGDDYGRGFVELNLGDMKSLNELEERLLDFAAMASKFLIGKDHSSQVRDRDLEKPTGSVFKARVLNGEIQDVGLLRLEKLADFRVVFQTAERKSKDLSAAMLLESEVQPRGDRVTAFQVQRIAMELEGTLGGLYAPIADDQQVPLLQRTIYQLERDNILPPLPDEANVEVKAITGIAALDREVRAGKVMNLMQAVGALGPQAMRRIDEEVLIDVLARYTGVHEPGLIKSDEQIQQEDQQAMQQQTQAAAAEKAVDVAGNVAQNAMTTEPNTEG